MDYKELSECIARKVENPRDWDITLRVLIERAGGNVCTMMPIGVTTLQSLCWQVFTNMRNRGLEPQLVVVAVKWAEESCVVF